jgi:Protein of unknown function (DUF5672)
MKNVTVVAIDSLQYEATAWALARTCKLFPDSPVLVISDKDFYPGSKHVHVPKFNRQEHSRICLHEVGKHVNTDYAMFIQYDGFPVDMSKWTNEFLKYDYIGAVWPWKPSPYRVGNGGFSLRSKRLLDATTHLTQIFGGPEDLWLEDAMISTVHYWWLVSKGIEFAPEWLAKVWSREHPEGRGPTFGFHDKFNLKHYLTPEELAEITSLIK